MIRNRGALIALLVFGMLILTVVPLVTVQANYGINWQGTFYNRPDLSGTGVGPVSIPSGLNFAWGDGPPTVSGASVPLSGCVAVAPASPGTDGGNSPSCNNYFSARFTSTQNITPGQYNFYVSSDDGVRLYINGGVVLDKFIGRAQTTDTVPVTITTSPVNLTVEYFEGYDQANLQVQWFSVGFNFPTATPTPSVPVRNYFEVSSIPLSWNRISWAIGYKVQVATDKLFSHVIWSDDTLSADTLSVTTPYLSNMVYYWRVKAKVNPTTWGNWSVGDRFTIQAQDIGINWQGTFYNRPDLSGTGVGPISIPSGLNFAWGDGPPTVPGASIPLSGCVAVAPASPGTDGGNSPGCNNYFSARFTSTQNLTPGQYNFVVSSDDGVRLYVNGGVVLDKFIGRAQTTDTVPVTITTSPVNLTVEYFEGYDQANLQVQWLLVSSSG